MMNLEKMIEEQREWKKADHHRIYFKNLIELLNINTDKYDWAIGEEKLDRFDFEILMLIVDSIYYDVNTDKFVFNSVTSSRQQYVDKFLNVIVETIRSKYEEVTTIIAFHGTNVEFETFNNYTEDDTNILNAIYFSTEIDLAESYAIQRVEELGGEKFIITCKLKLIKELTDDLSIERKIIEEYITEDYTDLFNSFDGSTTTEFALYVSLELYQEHSYDLLKEWGFNYTRNDTIISMFNTDDIEIIKT